MENGLEGAEGGARGEVLPLAKKEVVTAVASGVAD
jgi:hypothetical protein